MPDIHSRIITMRDMFFYAHSLYSWQLDNAFELIYSNSPEQDFFFNMFSVGYCYDAARKHFSQSSMPVILSDKLGIGWLITAQTEQDITVSYHMLGPFYTMEPSDKYIHQLCSRMQVSAKLFTDLFRRLKSLPTIPFNTITYYGIMLYYCVTGEQCTNSDIILSMENSKIDTENDWSNTNWHGTWEGEQKFFQMIEDGTVTDLASATRAVSSSGQVGVLAVDDPLRQAKNEELVAVTLASRAAIRGGVSPEGGYNLADYYFQKIENCKYVADVHNVGSEMLAAFLQRSIRAKKHNQHSIPIAAAQEYIETHIYEKISLKKLAKEVGYSDYYLTNRFQKEIGISMNQYIQQRKVETAKELLKSSKYDITDISDKLAFSSPSYFAAVFRKHTGMSPGEFVNRRGKE